ncbi:hypothetical protein [Bradyrhizobium sp. Tv2a-2]|uniref:hypothetical protein n=1 Tax=Bradyrhizobium sp. Tv2a-2 TaxID=113395 RepID=UPI0003FE5D53|nr:hypothetical protein [Bradyrhizobium sp. Tv2a-2]
MLAARVINHRAARLLVAAIAIVLMSAASAQTPEQMAEYRARLAQYNAAREAYQVHAAPYWAAVKAKRAERFAKRRAHREITLDDYVLIQPPEYTGPKKPVDPSATATEVPVVADFLRHAAEQFDFTPDRPSNEIAFKRAYARVAAAAGLTKDQAVRIYGFEATGNGTYVVQAGLEYDKPDAMPITTALGYNQLLSTNTVELLAEQGGQFIDALKNRAAEASGARKAALERKIATLRKMVAFSHSVRDDWNLHERLAGTPKGLAVHALNLDIDVGPLLQTQKLMTSVIFARQRGYSAPLTAAELEMMNLTGDGNGLDMISLPPNLRKQVPTSNFFTQSGYEHNPVARRANVVSALLAATDAVMDRETQLQGAKDLAAQF